jgi:hypothetical protein
MTTQLGLEVTFEKQTSDKMFINGFTGRGNSYTYIAVNENGQKGYLPNATAPYMPIGGVKALKEVLDILVWH